MGERRITSYSRNECVDFQREWPNSTQAGGSSNANPEDMKANERAFTIKELAVVLAVSLMLAFLFLVKLLPPSRRYGCTHCTQRIKCGNNLKNVGLAFRIYATDNNDQFPGSILLSNRTTIDSIAIWQVYASMSNELSTPKLVICPEDLKRQEAKSFGVLLTNNISYFASLSATGDNTTAFLAGDRNLQRSGRLLTGVFPLRTNALLSWSKDIHVEQGNVAMEDGSVQQISNQRLVGTIRDQGIETNLIIFP
jgi:hypothetical protein